MEKATMDKKYAILLVMFFAAVLAVSGCTTTKPTTTTTTGAFAGGTEGLAISLLNAAQFSQLYENNDFQIFVNVQNKGEGSLTPITVRGATAVPHTIYGYISLSGINVYSFKTNQTKEITDQLSPTKKIGAQISQGAPAQIIFDAKAPPIEGAQQQYTLYVSALYGYKSKATAMACLKENPYQQTVSGKEICKITGALPIDASGAPVKVTSIEENPSGFLIKVKNVGSGYPFKVGTFPQTESNLTLNDKNKVTISSVKLGTTNITPNCKPVDIYMSNNEGQFSCTANLTAISGAGTEQLVIDLSYGYITTTSTKLTVLGTD